MSIQSSHELESFTFLVGEMLYKQKWMNMKNIIRPASLYIGKEAIGYKRIYKIEHKVDGTEERDTELDNN